MRGRLREGCDALDALEAVLPAGTLSGAPKIRAMQLIAEYEHSPRGIYGGAAGYFSYSGNMDFAIVIRTMIREGKKLIMRAGAGIVADSVPAEEYQQEVPSEHMLTVTFPTTVELSIDGESQTIANLIGAYKDVVMADTELELTFTPRVEGREIAGVTVNGEAVEDFDINEFVYNLTMPNRL